jgi:hypothetical protein
MQNKSVTGNNNSVPKPPRALYTSPNTGEPYNVWYQKDYTSTNKFLSDITYMLSSALHNRKEQATIHTHIIRIGRHGNWKDRVDIKQKLIIFQIL